MTLDTLAVPLRHPQLLLHRLPLRLVPVPRSLHLVKPRLVFLATVTNISCMTQMVGLSSLFHLYLSLSLLLLFFFFFSKDNSQVAGVYCQDMVTENDITLDELYEWNPALNGDCSGLWLNYAYCVGVTSSTTAPTAVPATTTISASSTTTTSAASSCATVTAPGPTQTGIPCTCKKYLMRADGKLSPFGPSRPILTFFRRLLL